MQRALDFRTDLLSAPSCSFFAETTADFGQRIYEFTLDCTYDPETNGAALQVAAPEEIAGIRAAVDGETAQVTFEDVTLELGTLAGGHAAPMQLPQILGSAWTRGYIDSVAQAGEGILVTYENGYDADALTVYTYFDDTMTPERAEIYRSGDCVLRAGVKNFSIRQTADALYKGNGFVGE